MFSLQLKLFTLLSIAFHGALLGLLIYFAPKKVDVPPQPLKVGLVTLEKDPGIKKGNPGPPKEKEPEPVKKAEPPKPKPEKKEAKKKPVKKAPQRTVITRAPLEEKPSETASDMVNPSQAGDSDEFALSRPSSNAVTGSEGSGLGSSGEGKGGDSVGYPDYGINPKPKYPLIAKRYGYEGLVILSVYVLESGRVGKIQLKKSSGYDVLDNSALKAVKGWVFVPGMRNGKPASSWVVVPVRFNLTSG